MGEKMIDSNAQVLVTGGSGFLGSHCILQLLDQGYQVRTSVRSIAKKESIIKTLKEAGAKSLEKLTFVEADLSNESSWISATKDCKYVLHVASPFPLKMPKNEDGLVKPAVEGTLNVLKAASQNGVDRVVLTSSFAAFGYTHENEEAIITEENWTDTSKPVSVYVKSKTLAEKAAWDFIQNDNSDLDLSVICPRYILGPAIGPTLTTSHLALKQLFDGSMKATPNVSYGIIDVRDVADMHIRAMTHPDASGERFLASTDGLMTFHDIALLLRKELGSAADKAPTKVYPNWLVRAVALFNPAAKGIVPHLGKQLTSKNNKAEYILGWKPRPKEEAILSAAESIRNRNFIN